jgi:hypothetical protein
MGTTKKVLANWRLWLSASMTVLLLLGNPLAAFGAGWSQGVVFSPSLPTSAPNAFAFNPAGNEVWVTAPGVTGGAIVEVAQRSFGGAWSPLTTIATIPSVGFLVVQDLSISLSANNNAAAVWLANGVQIALRSPAGVWQAPVQVAPTTGAVLNVVARLDAQGNGVATWYRLTPTVSVVEAITWTAAGAFSNVVQLSSSSQGAFLPDIAVNEAGTAVVVWQAAAPLDNSSPYQVESATRPAGGSWSAVTAVSPVISQTWNPKVALDGSGNATVVWEQGATANNYRIYAATRPVGGAWGSPTAIETSYYLGQNSVAADAAGNVTASWVVDDTSGAMFIHTATRPAGGAWGTPTNLGECKSNGGSLCLTPPVAAARDGSITVVGWTAYGGLGNLSNVAVRLGSGQWVPMVISGNPQLTYVQATNNARASAVWPTANGVKYHHVFSQSDYQ